MRALSTTARYITFTLAVPRNVFWIRGALAFMNRPLGICFDTASSTRSSKAATALEQSFAAEISVTLRIGLASFRRTGHLKNAEIAYGIVACSIVAMLA